MTTDTAYFKRVKMKRLLLYGTGIFLALIGIYAGVKAYTAAIAEERVNDAIAEVSDFVSITYQDVDVDLIGFDFILTDVRFSPVGTAETVKARRIVVRSLDHQSEIPANLDVSVEGIAIRQLKKSAPAVLELGYDNDLLVDLDVSYNYDKPNRLLEINRISVDAAGAGRLEIRLYFGGIDLQTKNLFAILLAYPHITVNGAAVFYRDDSLTERWMQASAKQSNTDVQGYRNQLIEQIDQEIGEKDSDLSRSALKAIRGFIEDPGEISMVASPTRPQQLKRIIEVDHPGELIDMLNLRIESIP